MNTEYMKEECNSLLGVTEVCQQLLAKVTEHRSISVNGTPYLYAGNVCSSIQIFSFEDREYDYPITYILMDPEYSQSSSIALFAAVNACMDEMLYPDLDICDINVDFSWNAHHNNNIFRDPELKQAIEIHCPHFLGMDFLQYAKLTVTDWMS